MHKELQTGQIPVCCRVVSRYGSTVGLHFCCRADGQQPLDDAPATKAGRQVQWSGTSSILVLQAYRDQSSLFAVEVDSQELMQSTSHQCNSVNKKLRQKQKMKKNLIKYALGPILRRLATAGL